MNRKNLGTIGLVALTVLGAATAASAQVRIVNLSDKSAYVARLTYSAYQSSIPAGDYNLPAVSPEGWSFQGWWKVGPGETYEGPAGTYFVKRDGRQITWNGLKRMTGFVRRGKFSTFVSRAGWQGESAKLLGQGYKKVNYQTMKNGVWKISGNAYRLTSKTFNFNFSSRSINFHNKRFSVPGKLSYTQVSASSWRANGVHWGKYNDSTVVTLSTEGAQKRPFGPREPGYYRGTVTVHYTERS